MRISDWSSDVCSSDLTARAFAAEARSTAESALSAAKATLAALDSEATALRKAIDNGASHHRALDRIKAAPGDRKSVVVGKSGSVRLNLGGRRILKKKKK